MGVPPNIWGPNLWGTLHLLCFAGTITPEFVQEFANVIPCPMCAAHFTEVLKEVPLPDSNDPQVLFEWSVEAHNIVNERTGKPVFTVDQARVKWLTRPEPEAPPPPQFDFKIGILLGLLLAALFYFIIKLSSCN